MYSPLIIDKNLHKARKLNLELKRRSTEDRIEISRRLGMILDAKTKRLTRPLTFEEKQFIQSEQILCRLDYKYFAKAYVHIELDSDVAVRRGDNTVAPMLELWPSQEIALDLLAKREEAAWDQFEREGFSEGILSVYNKARQQGVTAFWRSLGWHRAIFYKNTRALSVTIGSPNDVNKLELYKRDKIILDNLPWFFQVQVKADVKGEELSLDAPVNSVMRYADDTQKAGIGTGSQTDFNHNTEVGLWAAAERLEMEFLPGVPKSPRVLLGWESTANGRGNFWYLFTEAVRKKKRGFEHWVYTFIPWYLIETKYRRLAPEDWRPNANTQAHAEMIERTSAEWNKGKTYRPTKHQLYWWESEYARAEEQGTLAHFFSSYPATPEESFQHFAGAAFDHRTLEWVRQCVRPGHAYEVRLN